MISGVFPTLAILWFFSIKPSLPSKRKLSLHLGQYLSQTGTILGTPCENAESEQEMQEPGCHFHGET